jgi:recombination protein RecA
MSDNKDALKRRLEGIHAKTVKSYGARSAILGNERYEMNVVPSPSLMLDYKLGKGGFPYGAMVEIFGSNGLGKTTVLAYGTLANVQKEGKLPALIAMEPHAGHEETVEWAVKLHGLDPDLLLIEYPDNVEEAFEMLYDLVFDYDIDYIVLDSIGAMGAASTQESGKQKAYGVSSQVTAGLNAVMPRLFKANKGLMILNQQRQAGAANGNTFYESPGGEALKHHALVRIQVKPGGEKYYSMVDGEKVLVGREIKCTFKKNKMAQAVGKSAEFTFFNIDTEEYGLGIDKVSDVVNTGKLSGVIQSSGSWLQHPVFPKGQVQGVAKAKKFFTENPDAYGVIRDDVMKSMIHTQEELAKQKRAKKAPVEEADDGEAGDE